MAFPTIVTETSSANNTNQNNQVISLPASLVSGNLLVVALSLDGLNSVTWPAGWTEIIDANRSGVTASVAWRRIDGSEGATITVTVDASASEMSCAKVWQISGDDTGQAPEAASANNNGATPNPPSLTPTGGAKDYLWLVFACLQPGSNVATGFPTGFTNTGQEAGSANASQSPIAWATLNENTATKDPDAFAATSNNWMAVTIAVHPAAAAAGQPTRRRLGGVHGCGLQGLQRDRGHRYFIF